MSVKVHNSAKLHLFEPPQLDASEIKLAQQCNQFADKLQYASVKDVTYLLRYEVSIDSGYIAQSVARVSVWKADELTWSNLWQLNVASSYEISKADAEQPNELLSSYSNRGAEKIAESWQKIYDELHDYATVILKDGQFSGKKIR